MAIIDWPQAQRPREKLIQQGAAALSDAELLAIFIQCGYRGKSAVGVARELLQTFGGMRGMMSADLDSFSSVRGLGLARYCLVQSAMELTSRHLSETLMENTVLGNAASVKRFLLGKLGGLQHEVFAGLFLDSQHQLITYQQLFNGTIDRTSVYPREVLKKALALNAANLILAHNHPSGRVEPSQADRQITDQLRKTLALIDVAVIDHIIVGGDRTLSFAERGWL